MLKNRGLTIGLSALVILVAISSFLLKGNSETAQAADPSPATITSTAAKSGDAPAAEPAPAAAQSADLLAAPAASKLDVEGAMKEQVLGKDDAPVTIYEYASFTCPHCAYFATTVLPDVKKKLLDTGKAKLVFRDFPLDNFALKASMMSHCVSPIKYYNMVEVLFTNQERWTKDSDPQLALGQLASLAGLDNAEFKACVENKDLETAILTRMKDGQEKFKIDSTPTFIFNDGTEKLKGAQSVDKFEEIVNKLSAGK